jgi:hypothetical protein
MNAREQLLAQLRARDPDFKARVGFQGAADPDLKAPGSGLSPLLIKTPVRHDELRKQLLAQMELGDDSFTPLNAHDVAEESNSSRSDKSTPVSLSLEMPSQPLTVPSGVTYVRWDTQARMWQRVG